MGGKGGGTQYIPMDTGVGGGGGSDMSGMLMMMAQMISSQNESMKAWMEQLSANNAANQASVIDPAAAGTTIADVINSETSALEDAAKSAEDDQASKATGAKDTATSLLDDTGEDAGSSTVAGGLKSGNDNTDAPNPSLLDDEDIT